jgi:hypothetical protein
VVIVEHCGQCGFDGEEWSDVGAMEAIPTLATRWREVVTGLTSDELHHRPIAEMWSIAEYADHVREVLFGMRFVLDVAVTQPGTDLGESPQPRFEPEPRAVDVAVALFGIETEASALRGRLGELPDLAWDSTATLDGKEVGAHWVVRHAVHDATHHLLDAETLRAAL